MTNIIIKNYIQQLIDSVDINELSVNYKLVDNQILIDPNYYFKPEIQVILDLIKYYNPDLSVPKINDNDELNRKQELLLDYLEKKPYYNVLCKLLKSDTVSVRKFIKMILFELYNVFFPFNNTCAFGHIYVGEYNDHNFLGFHSWIIFCYYQQIKKIENIVLSDNKDDLIVASFTYNNKPKNMCTFIIGINPMLEICMIALVTYYFSATYLMIPVDIKNKTYTFIISNFEKKLRSFYPLSEELSKLYLEHSDFYN